MRMRTRWVVRLGVEASSPSEEEDESAWRPLVMDLYTDAMVGLV